MCLFFPLACFPHVTTEWLSDCLIAIIARASHSPFALLLCFVCPILIKFDGGEWIRTNAQLIEVPRATYRFSAFTFVFPRTLRSKSDLNGVQHKLAHRQQVFFFALILSIKWTRKKGTPKMSATNMAPEKRKRRENVYNKCVWKTKKSNILYKGEEYQHNQIMIFSFQLLFPLSLYFFARSLRLLASEKKLLR